MPTNNIICGNHIDSLASSIRDAMPNVFTGATTLAGGTNGLVPAPAINDRGKFLSADGTWTQLANVAFIGSASSTVEGAFWLED